MTGGQWEHSERNIEESNLEVSLHSLWCIGVVSLQTVPGITTRAWYYNECLTIHISSQFIIHNINNCFIYSKCSQCYRIVTSSLWVSIAGLIKRSRRTNTCYEITDIGQCQTVGKNAQCCTKHSIRKKREYSYTNECILREMLHSMQQSIVLLLNVEQGKDSDTFLCIYLSTVCQECNYRIRNV